MGMIDGLKICNNMSMPSVIILESNCGKISLPTFIDDIFLDLEGWLVSLQEFGVPCKEL